MSLCHPYNAELGLLLILLLFGGEGVGEDGERALFFAPKGSARDTRPGASPMGWFEPS